MGPYRTVHIALYMFTHVLHVFLVSSDETHTNLHCYICQVLLYDNIYLSYSSGLAPLKMYRELQRDMGPYRAVRIALYMFTHILQVNMCSDEIHTSFTLFRSCCRINTEYRETSLVWCHIVTRAYGTCDNTGNRLVIFPCTQ